VIVEELRFEDEVYEKLAAHSLTPERVVQVLDHPYRVRRNRVGRRATHLLVGRDDQGQCIVIPIVRTGQRTVWEVVTAWFCKPYEWGWLP